MCQVQSLSVVHVKERLISAKIGVRRNDHLESAGGGRQFDSFAANETSKCGQFARLRLKVSPFLLNFCVDYMFANGRRRLLP